MCRKPPSVLQCVANHPLCCIAGVQGLRYGENPHQAAAFYVDQSLGEAGKGGVATSVQHNGKEMSYNNYLDADAAYQCSCDFKVTTYLPTYL